MSKKQTPSKNAFISSNKENKLTLNEFLKTDEYKNLGISYMSNDYHLFCKAWKIALSHGRLSVLKVNIK